MKHFTFKLGTLGVCLAVADIHELEAKNAEASSARVSEPGDKKSTGTTKRKEPR